MNEKKNRKTVKDKTETVQYAMSGKIIDILRTNIQDWIDAIENWAKLARPLAFEIKYIII